MKAQPTIALRVAIVATLLAVGGLSACSTSTSDSVRIRESAGSSDVFKSHPQQSDVSKATRAQDAAAAEASQSR